MIAFQSIESMAATIKCFLAKPTDALGMEHHWMDTWKWAREEPGVDEAVVSALYAMVLASFNYRLMENSTAFYGDVEGAVFHAYTANEGLDTATYLLENK